MINDVTALSDPDMAKVVAKENLEVVLMHMQGTPQSMQANPHYKDVVGSVRSTLIEKISQARHAGIQHIIIDPGIGFGKTCAHNLSLLKHVDQLVELGVPVLIGPSRKSFIGEISGASVDQRMPGTIAACLGAYQRGVSFFRVHDVAAIKQAFQVLDAIEAAK
jgi:dihydropteroate synthase